VNADEIRDLAAVYALGGLEGEDRARFEALLRAGDPDATSAVQDFQGTLLELAAATTEAPPARIKQALMERIGAQTRVESSPSISPVRPGLAATPARRSWWPAVWAAAMAAGIAAIAVGLSLSSVYEKRLAALAEETRALRAVSERQQAILALVRDPGTQVVTLAGLEPALSAKARMIWNAPKGGLLVTTGLPATPPGKAYQLWAIAGTNAPVSAGVFEVGADGTASVGVSPLPGVDKVDVFAVTLEPAGGVPAPTGQMYLAGKA